MATYVTKNAHIVGMLINSCREVINENMVALIKSVKDAITLIGILI